MQTSFSTFNGMISLGILHYGQKGISGFQMVFLDEGLNFFSPIIM